MLRIIDRDFSHGSWSLGLGSIADGAQRRAIPSEASSIDSATSVEWSPDFSFAITVCWRAIWRFTSRQYADQPQHGDGAPDRGPRRSPSKIAHTLTQMATLC